MYTCRGENSVDVTDTVASLTVLGSSSYQPAASFLHSDICVSNISPCGRRSINSEISRSVNELFDSLSQCHHILSRDLGIRTARSTKIFNSTATLPAHHSPASTGSRYVTNPQLPPLSLSSRLQLPPPSPHGCCFLPPLPLPLPPPHAFYLPSLLFFSSFFLPPPPFFTSAASSFYVTGLV